DAIASTWDACATQMRRSMQNRISGISHAVFHHGVDIRGMRDVVQRIRIENHKVSKTAVFEFADTRTDFAAKKLRSVGCSALQYLHGREPGFFHQLKFTEESGPVNGPDVPCIR